jgi:hypothetical protein
MAAMIGNGLYHCVIRWRILGGYALREGMPLWKYVANRFLTLSENLLVGAKLSEYHSGYRAFSRQLLNDLTWSKTQTISCSITRCLFRLYGTAMRSQRLLVLPITTRKLHPSRKGDFGSHQPCHNSRVAFHKRLRRRRRGSSSHTRGDLADRGVRRSSCTICLARR